MCWVWREGLQRREKNNDALKKLLKGTGGGQCGDTHVLETYFAFLPPPKNVFLPCFHNICFLFYLWPLHLTYNSKLFLWSNYRCEILSTHILTYSLWCNKIHMGPIISCGSLINLVVSMWILTRPTWFDGSNVNFIKSKRVCWKMCVKMYFASISHYWLENDLYKYWTYYFWTNLHNFLSVHNS